MEASRNINNKYAKRSRKDVLSVLDLKLEELKLVWRNRKASGDDQTTECQHPLHSDRPLNNNTIVKAPDQE